MTASAGCPDPARGYAFAALVAAEVRAMSRSTRAVLWTLAVPVLILALGEAQVPAALRGASVPTLQISAFAVTTGTFALALFGYATSLATYRERGVLERLRCTPVPPAALLVARLLAQLLAIPLQSGTVLAVAALAYGAHLSTGAVASAGAVSLLGGLCALALGQLVVALVRKAAEVLAAARFTLIAVLLLNGVFVGVSRWPPWLRNLARWTPVRLMEDLLAASLGAAHSEGSPGPRLAVLLAWTVACALLGVFRFRWERA